MHVPYRGYFSKPITESKGQVGGSNRYIMIITAIYIN
jgi:hypothetical protein